MASKKKRSGRECGARINLVMFPMRVYAHQSKKSDPEQLGFVCQWVTDMSGQ